MGKGEIIQHGADGLYQVKLLFDRRRIESEIESLTNKIAAITLRIAGMMPGKERDLANLQKASMEKRKEYLETAPEDPTISAWCADLSKELAGIVGTIEVPGEIGAVNIQPGHDENADYNSDRDGQLQSPIAGPAAGTFYNLAMLPGWQKWMPTYRYGTITEINYTQDVCNIDLDDAISSTQNLEVNQVSSLTGVPIVYMWCNSGAFDVSDRVLVKFEDQDWENGKVIGFESNPKPCFWEGFDSPYLCTFHIWNFNISGSEFQCVLPGGSNPELVYKYDQPADNTKLTYACTFDLTAYFLTYPYWDATISGVGDDPVSARYCKFKITTFISGTGSGSDRSFIALKLMFDDSSTIVFLLDGDATTHYSGAEHDYTSHGGNDIEVDLSTLGITTEKVVAVTMDSYCVGQGTMDWQWDYVDFYE